MLDGLVKKFSSGHVAARLAQASGRDPPINHDYLPHTKSLGVLSSFDRNQGQDEVPRGAVVTDYSDSVLVPSAIVNHTNEEIRKLGGEKVRMYAFRSKNILYIPVASTL